MEDQRDYYQILHVQRDAPLEIIKASYRAVMRKLKSHPDLGGAHEEAAAINEAYEVLSDPEKRARYDQQSARASDQYPRRTSKKQDSGQQSACAFCKAPCSPDAKVDPEACCFHCESPLALVSKEKPHPGYERVLQRIRKEGDILYHTTWPSTGSRGQIQDLSPQGMRLLTSRLLPDNEMVKIDSRLFQATGRVAHCQSTVGQHGFDYSVGIQFVTVMFPGPRGNFMSESA